MTPDETLVASGAMPRMTALADRLAQARSDNRQIASLPEDEVPQSWDEAYAVDAMVAERLGWERLGWKIAGTTARVREELSLPGPIYGRSYRRFLLDSPATLETANLLDPMVECEFFVTLTRDLPPREAEWMMPEIMDAIGAVHAGIEVAEVRYPLRSPLPMPAVLADGSANGHYVRGGAILDWRLGLADVEVVLEVDGVVNCRARGAEVMGDPLVPVLWLANERRRWGDGLRAGETISTGSTTGILPIEGAHKIRAAFRNVATVEIEFA